jgi:2-polyprenyl-3-methyl-5-hydroxy-6-metoxy-1,4-benzoquinol methylase
MTSFMRLGARNRLDAGARRLYVSAMTSSNLNASDLDPASPEFAARRAEARQKLDALDPAMQEGAIADPLRREWFEQVYRLAENDPARVPWANLTPHPLTRAWVQGQVRGLTGLKALDVGCGLGDNAECLAAAGAKVMAFDLVPEAISWAKQRFPETEVDYQVAELFTLPAAWQGAFDLVHECYTLQALSVALVPKALGVLAQLLAPDGHLLVVARARGEEDEVSGPPWPLPPSFIETAEQQGLTRVMVEDISATAQVSRRHWRVLFRREPQG